VKLESCTAFITTEERKYVRHFVSDVGVELSISTSIDEDGIAEILIRQEFGSGRIVYRCGLTVNAEPLRQSLASAMRDREARLKKQADTLTDFLAENPDIHRKLVKFERQRRRKTKAST